MVDNNKIISKAKYLSQFLVFLLFSFLSCFFLFSFFFFFFFELLKEYIWVNVNFFHSMNRIYKSDTPTDIYQATITVLRIYSLIKLKPPVTKGKPEKCKLENWAKLMQIFTGHWFLVYLQNSKNKKKYLQRKIIHSLVEV